MTIRTNTGQPSDHTETNVSTAAITDYTGNEIITIKAEDPGNDRSYAIVVDGNGVPSFVQVEN